MKATLRIRPRLVRALTRAAVAGALILCAAPAVAHAAEGPAAPLAEPQVVHEAEPTPGPAPAAPTPDQETPAADETAATPEPVPAEPAPPVAEEPAPPVAEQPAPPVADDPAPPVAEPPPAGEPTPPATEPTPPVTEAQTPPTKPTPEPVATPAPEAAPTPKKTDATTGPATPTAVGAPATDEATALPLPSDAIPTPPAVDAAPRPADPAKRGDIIRTGPPAELIGATVVAPLASTVPASPAREAAAAETTTSATATRVIARRPAGGAGDAGAAAVTAAPSAAPAQAAAATPVRHAPRANLRPRRDGFRLATPLQPGLGADPHARPQAEAAQMPRRSTVDKAATSSDKGLFSARVEAPMDAVVGGSSLLAVLASYALPGSGPVPMTLALVLFAQLAIMIGAMRAPRVHLSERLVILGLLAGNAGHRRAVQRPG